MPTAANHWSREPGRWDTQLQPEDWATIPDVATPKPSPDGRNIAYSHDFDGRLDVMVIAAAGGPPTQLTGVACPQEPDLSHRQAHAIAWTPDSEAIVFASQCGKLWRVPAAGGPSRPLEDASGAHHSPAISPDGGRVAFVSERGEQADIVIVDIAGTSVCQLTGKDDDENVAEPKWSPDGRHLLYQQWPHYDMPWDEMALVVADIQTGERKVIAGGEGVVNNWASWSADGQWIAYISDRDAEHPTLWRVRPDSGEMQPLVQEDHDHLWPAPSPDGRRIAYTRNADNQFQIWLWEDGKTRQLTNEPGVHSDLAWIDADRLVCVFQSPLAPPDLWEITTRGPAAGERRQLTFSATGGVLGGGLCLPEVISWTSRDGLPITGMLYTPPPETQQPGRHPLIIHIHGGPNSQANLQWLPWVHYFVQRGYVVLVPNYRGSKGYGRSFVERIYGDWGGREVDDHVSGAEAVIARGLVDPSRVIADGGSAGGYATLMCLMKAPAFFKAGISRYGLADIETFTDKTWPFDRAHITKLMGGPGGQCSELYYDRSPLNFVEDVRGPLLILQGENDIVTHRSEMDTLAPALAQAGKHVEYTVYPDEGHGWRRVSTIIDDARRSDDFLVRMVLNR